MHYKNLESQKGFTLIEMLIVVLVIAALSAVLINIIDPADSQGKARDGVRVNNIKNISEGIESYKLAEGAYPLDNDPLNPNSVLLQTYLREWPVPVADDGSVDAENFSYRYAQAGDGFVLYTRNSSGGCYKYQTDWSGVMSCPIEECANTISLESECN